MSDLVLIRFMLQQGGDKAVRQCNRAMRFLVFRWLELQPAGAGLTKGLINGQAGILKIDVAPAKPKDFTAPHSGAESHQDGKIQNGILGRSKQ